MPLKEAELVNLFFNDMPEDVLLDTARCAIGAYQEAYKYTRDNFPGEEAHDLYPILRRSMFERNWRSRLIRNKALTVSVEVNAAGNCYHTLVGCGRVIMTASAVERPSEMPRDAVYRKTLATPSQIELFDEPEEVDEDAPLYAMLLHGPLGAGLLQSPMFLHVGFPTADCENYVTRVNLAERFPTLATELSIKPTVVQRRKLRLRQNRESQKAE
jgi:hypothetical protein